MDNEGKIKVHVPTMYNEFPLSDYLKNAHIGTPIPGDLMEKCFGHHLGGEMMKAILRSMPHAVVEFVEFYCYDYGSFSIESFYGTPEELSLGAEAYLDNLIGKLFVGGRGGNDYFDYLPAATFEFAFLCNQIGNTDLMIQLYDSLWLEGHAYYPPADYEVEIYRAFENIGPLALHLDHPKKAR